MAALVGRGYAIIGSAVTPGQLLGRMNATIRLLVWGTLPIGGLFGGLPGGAGGHSWRPGSHVAGRTGS